MVKYLKGDYMEKSNEEIFSDYGFDLTKKQLKQFDLYFDVLSEWNEKINLTAIENKNQVYLKHFLDSLMMGKFFDLKNLHLLDVGSGAGFPGIPLKILYPSLKLTIIDALKKRIAFLKHLCDVLNVDVELIHGRVEEHKHKSMYDIVTGRAVSSLNVLLELCVPFVKSNGVFIAYKSSKHEQEAKEASNAIHALNVTYDGHLDYDIKNEFRTLMVFKKSGPTPEKYPRRFKKIKSKPL